MQDYSSTYAAAIYVRLVGADTPTCIQYKFTSKPIISCSCMQMRLSNSVLTIAIEVAIDLPFD